MSSFNRVSAFNHFRLRVQEQKSVVSTLINYCSAWLCGVHLGSGCKFYGNTTFQKANHASIIFGDRCVFRSSPRSNLIGVNRPCIVSAQQTATLKVGSDCGFSGIVIGCFSEINIGDKVRCGANTLITDGDWHLDDPRASKPQPIQIGSNVWLGANVTVMKGVSIGDDCVIGAGSVVTKDIPQGAIAAGNPCRVIKERV